MPYLIIFRQVKILRSSSSSQVVVIDLNHEDLLLESLISRHSTCKSPDFSIELDWLLQEWPIFALHGSISHARAQMRN